MKSKSVGISLDCACVWDSGRLQDTALSLDGNKAVPTQTLTWILAAIGPVLFPLHFYYADIALMLESLLAQVKNDCILSVVMTKDDIVIINLAKTMWL